MTKEPLLFASPFPPMQTGVADLSMLLVEALREHFEIILLVENRNDLQLSGFEVVDYRTDNIDWERFPLRFYNIGNNPWYHSYIYDCCIQNPGLVLLHEPVIYYLYVGHYRASPDFYARVLEEEGPRGISIIRRMIKQGCDLLRFPEPHLLPFNRELIHSGNAFMTHSEYALQSVLARAEHPVPVRKINQAVPALPAWSTANCLAARRRLGLPEDAVVLASFGFVAPTKLNDLICAAVNRLNSARTDKAHYIMVGEGSYVDPFLNDYVRVTGYVDSRQYDDYLAACDLVLNLRYPAMGETSAAALRALRAGRPCVFTNDGWFGELPDDIAVKIEPDPPEITQEVLYRLLQLFLDDRRPFEAYGRNAAAYTAKHHDARVIARQIAEYIHSLA